MSKIKVEAKTRKDLRLLASKIRHVLKISPDEPLNPPAMLETLHLWDPVAHFEIVQPNELKPSEHAVTDVIHKTIKIRTDVYDRACEGKGRDRMTIMHEFAHFLMLTILGFKLARSFDKDLPAYEDPEWQAKCLAGELMMPANKIKNMSISEIASHYGVSESAARIQKQHCY